MTGTKYVKGNFVFLHISSSSSTPSSRTLKPRSEFLSHHCVNPNYRFPIIPLFQSQSKRPLFHHSRRHDHQFIRKFSSSQSSHANRSNVVEILEERGLLESLTSENLRSVCSDSSLRVYCGFDPTAETLHLGNLIGIIVLSWFLRCGHSAVVLLGGATGRIGDPSGKSLERPELDVQTLNRNIAGISDTILSILKIDDDSVSIRVLNNYDWWKDVKFLDFLKDVGRFARVNTMMAKESRSGFSLFFIIMEFIIGY